MPAFSAVLFTFSVLDESVVEDGSAVVDDGGPVDVLIAS